MKKQLLLTFLIPFVGFSQSTTVNLNPSQDNTIYQELVNNSNGLGSLFSGVNGIGEPIRALLQFDLSSIPNGATIESVTLTVNVDRENTGTSLDYTLHRLTRAWGEGTSQANSDPAVGGGGDGNPAVAPDATWNDAMFGTQSWTTSGGDFIATASGTTTFSDTTGDQTFATSTGLVNDVQNWINGVNPNYGWILISSDEVNPGARRMGSIQVGVAPVLSITFDDTLSTEDFTLANAVQVYPNPSNDGIFNITADNVNLQNAEIINFLGQSIETIDLRDDDRLKRIDLSNVLNNGIYFMRLNDDQGRFTTKRIIMNN